MTYGDFTKNVRKNGENFAAWALRLLLAAGLGVTISLLTSLNTTIQNLDRTMSLLQLNLAQNYYTKEEISNEIAAVENQMERHIDRLHDRGAR